MAKRVVLLCIFAWAVVACGPANHIGSTKSKTSSASASSPSRSGNFKSYQKSAKACFYADKYNGNKTASGETFSNSKYTAAHKKLPFGTRVKVTNKANGKSVVVTINDRGSFSGGFDIDLAKKAFMEITDNKNHGSLSVSLDVEK
jgi:rare lipoprotein A